MRCTAYDYESPNGKKFCGDCGKPLAEAAKPAVSPPDPRAYTPKHLADKILQSKSALEGERKQVTVLFADAIRARSGITASVPWRRALTWQPDPVRFFGVEERSSGDVLGSLVG
jgi:hypothetical protein